ncbi:dTMP kinase, partial [Acinetobacter baumannii]
TTFAERGIGDVLLAWENEAHLAIREGYETLWKAEPERIKRLDATQSPDQVFEQALQYLA